MNSVAQLDETKVQQMIITSIMAWNTALETKITQLLDSKFSAFIQHQQNASRSISAATPLGATVSHGLPGLLQSPPISNVFEGAPGNSTVVPNDYDKAVEVEQWKLCDPILTPAAIRAWKRSFDVYAKNPNRRMTMYEAFGTQSMRSLMIMFPDGPIPMDNTSFKSYINEKFMKTTNLFSEIKLAFSKNAMEKGAHLMVESLYLYLAAFCTSISPFSEEMAIRNSSQDLHKTLIQAFYDGIVHVSFKKKLEETSCSTWQAARQNFQDCLTPTNVQLAITQQKAYFANKPNNPSYHQNKPDYEGIKGPYSPKPQRDQIRSCAYHSLWQPEKATRQAAPEVIGKNAIRCRSTDTRSLQKL